MQRTVYPQQHNGDIGHSGQGVNVGVAAQPVELARLWIDGEHAAALPLPAALHEQFDVLLDIGSIEHVFDTMHPDGANGTRLVGNDGKVYRVGPDGKGALFSKVLAERSAGKYNVDVIQFSEPSTALDFQKRGGYLRYVSPQNEFYTPDHLSTPVGDYFWVGVSFAGIAYNTDKVKPADAPKVWKDVLNPQWLNGVSVKQSTSGMQFVQWYELRRLYGDGFWKDFAKLRPRGFDSRAQLFDRLAKGDDKMCAMAEYAGFALIKDKGAHVVFVAPPDGLPAAPLLNGVVDKAPHPEAAKLFVDWLMSLRGQTHYQNNPYLYYGSVRKDAPPMLLMREPIAAPNTTKYSDVVMTGAPMLCTSVRKVRAISKR